MGRYSQNFFQADLTLPLLLNHMLHLQPTCLQNNKICIPFPVIPITNIQIQISIKPTCDRPIYLTASADKRLACLKQTSFHGTISLWIHFLQLRYKIKLLLTPFLHTQQGHLLFYSPNLSFILQVYYNRTQPFIFPAFIFKPLASNPDCHRTIFSRRLSSLCRQNQVIPEANLLVALWL